MTDVVSKLSMLVGTDRIGMEWNGRDQIRSVRSESKLSLSLPSCVGSSRCDNDDVFFVDWVELSLKTHRIVVHCSHCGYLYIFV